MTFSDERDKAMYLCSLIIGLIATVAFIIYMLFGSMLAAYMALGIYAFAFSLVSIFSIRKIFLILNYKERIKNYEEKATLSDAERVEFNSKRDKIMSVIKSTWRGEIVKAIIFGAFAIFTIVVLVLF